MRRAALTKDPQPHAVQIDSREIVARDIAAIPPTRLDALRFPQKAQGTPASRQTIALRQKSRHGEEPEGATESGPGR